MCHIVSTMYLDRAEGRGPASVIAKACIPYTPYASIMSPT